MEKYIAKTELLEKIRTERETLETILRKVSDDRMAQPGVESNWSVKDILAHISVWERRMIQWVEESLRGETPERPAPGMTWDDLDRLNEQTYQLDRDKPLDEVSAEFRNSYQRSLKTVEALSEDDLNDPQRFEWRKSDPLWHMVAANTFWHYKDHAETIAAWLEK